MNSYWNKVQEFPQNHAIITPDNDNDLIVDMIVMAGSDGDLSVQDRKGTTITYTVTAGTLLPVVVSRVLADNTTVTQIIGLY